MLRTLVTLLFLAPLCAAQTENEMTSLVHNLAARLRSPDGVQQYQMPDFEAEITSNPEINAYANVVDGHKILLNKTLVQVFYNAPGELAFIMAHEVGHLQNETKCNSRGARTGLAGNALRRECESEADHIGMQYLLAAGFSPYDAAGAMGRLLMADPGRNSVMAVMISRFTSTHPVNMDRVKQLAEYALEACEDRPEICQR